jgi:hypothetical protein
VRLERAYRRLIRAYPRAYQEARGNEIIATLMDGATPGQRRPRAREVVDVLTGGVRQHLGVGGSAGYADGLRTVLPVALVLATATAAAIRVGGLDSVPTIQPYAYAWCLALVAWAIRPSAGRVLTVLAALFTLRIAAMWSYEFGTVFGVCLVGLVAAFAAVAAPPGPATVDGREIGSALWSHSGRILTLAVGSGLGAVALTGSWWWSRWAGGAPLVAVLALAVAGAALAARRLGTSVLWAAALLLPAAAVLPIYAWPYDLPWNWDDGRYQTRPWLLLRSSMDSVADILFPLVCATAVVAILVAAVKGPDRLWRATGTLTRSTLAGLAVFVATVEATAGVPSVAVLAGCVVLAVGAVAVTAPRWMVLATMTAGGSAALTDVFAADRYGRPWPLYVLALLAALVCGQTLHPGTRASRTPALLGTVVALALMAAYTVRLYNLAEHDPTRYAALEDEPLFLTVPTFVLGAVAAGLVSARAPIRAGVSVLVAAIPLMLLAWPTPNPLVLGGVAVTGAVLAVLIGVTARRWGGAMALNSAVER